MPQGRDSPSVLSIGERRVTSSEAESTLKTHRGGKLFRNNFFRRLRTERPPPTRICRRTRQRKRLGLHGLGPVCGNQGLLLSPQAPGPSQEDTGKMRFQPEATACLTLGSGSQNTATRTQSEPETHAEATRKRALSREAGEGQFGKTYQKPQNFSNPWIQQLHHQESKARITVRRKDVYYSAVYNNGKFYTNT